MKRRCMSTIIIIACMLMIGCSGKDSNNKKTLKYVDFSDKDYQLFKLGEIQYHMPVGYEEKELFTSVNEEDETQFLITMMYKKEDKTCTYYVDYNTNHNALENFKDVKDKAFQERIIKQNEDSDIAFELISSKNIVVAGHDAWEMEYILNVNDKTTYSKIVYFRTDSALYNISLSDKTGTTGTYSDDFEGVISSIVIK